MESPVLNLRGSWFVFFPPSKKNPKKSHRPLDLDLDLDSSTNSTPASPAQAAGRPLPSRGVPTPRPELARQLRHFFYERVFFQKENPGPSAGEQLQQQRSNDGSTARSSGRGENGDDGGDDGGDASASSSSSADALSFFARAPAPAPAQRRSGLRHAPLRHGRWRGEVPLRSFLLSSPSRRWHVLFCRERRRRKRRRKRQRPQRCRTLRRRLRSHPLVLPRPP